MCKHVTPSDHDLPPQHRRVALLGSSPEVLWGSATARAAGESGMWSDGRRFYDVTPSGDQDYAVRTSGLTGKVVRFTKHLIRREASTGKWLWQGAHRTFELGRAWGVPCMALPRWRPELHLDADSSHQQRFWPHPLQEERVDMHEEHRGVKNQEAAPLSNTAVRWPASTAGALRSSMGLCESSRGIQERADARLKCATSPALVWLETGKRLKEKCSGTPAASGGHGTVSLTYLDIC